MLELSCTLNIVEPLNLTSMLKACRCSLRITSIPDKRISCMQHENSLHVCILKAINLSMSCPILPFHHISTWLEIPADPKDHRK